jgi:beta-N-acetylhexosaminidase
MPSTFLCKIRRTGTKAAGLALLVSLLLSSPPAAATSREARLPVMIGQMLMAGFRGTEVGPGHPVLRDIREYHLGAVILFDRDILLGQGGRNITGPQQVRELVDSLQKRARIPLLVAVDQEGGAVARLSPGSGFPRFPSAQKLGALGDVRRTRNAGARAGRLMAELGIRLNLAPVVDVNVYPESPAIGELGRSFSADPAAVVRHAAAYIRGLHRQGVLSCIKHFPGHGSSRSDSHLGMPDITDAWSRRELAPFRILISKGLCDAVMTAHLYHEGLDPEYPATLSKRIVTGMLRGDMGYQGVVVSDDMQMRAITEHFGLKRAVRLAVQAGVDVLIFGNNLRYDPDIVPRVHGLLTEMVRAGRISESSIQSSYTRIMELKRTLKHHTKPPAERK